MIPLLSGLINLIEAAALRVNPFRFDLVAPLGSACFGGSWNGSENNSTVPASVVTANNCDAKGSL
jgi:hypothetical protein